MTEGLRFHAGFGDPKAPIDSEPYATRWRIDLQAAIKHLGVYPEKVRSLYELGEKHRLWTFLADESGLKFKSFKQFCSTREPFGLGADESIIRAVLEEKLGKRGAALETVAEPSPGPGRGHTEELKEEKNSRHDRSFGNETAKRLRAINRAPDVVKDAYREGLINQDLAAKLGPKNPDGETAARNAKIAREIRGVRDRNTINEIVRKRLGMAEVTPLVRALGIVRNLEDDDLRAFAAQFPGILMERGLS